MKIVIAVDKFKHSLTSFEACRAIQKGLLAASPIFQIKALPLADGGEGLAEVLAHYHPFQKLTATVCNPLWKPVAATYLFSAESKTAFIEMAQASGLHLLQPGEYNCAITTTFGTGELIRAAIKRGAQAIIMGIGGSATNDCGIGMAAALGYLFLDAEGKEVAPVGKNLGRIQSIDASKALALQHLSVQVACDVTNYLTGEEGATQTYGPQKGAGPEVVAELESGMQHFAAVVKQQMGVDMTTILGGGAAGGMGAGCVAFLGATLIRGADVAFFYSRAEQHIVQADVVITGEGKLDAQTRKGKLVDAVAALCHKHQKPVIALCGTVDLSPAEIKSSGLTAAFSILPQPATLEAARQNAAEWLCQTAFAVGGLLGLRH